MKNKNQTKNKKTKNIKSLIEVKRLLKDQNIVSGYYEDCAHENFTQKSSFCPCPWDNRVLNGSNRDTSYGCYYNCSKNDDKIIEIEPSPPYFVEEGVFLFFRIKKYI